MSELTARQLADRWTWVMSRTLWPLMGLCAVAGLWVGLFVLGLALIRGMNLLILIVVNLLFGPWIAFMIYRAGAATTAEYKKLAETAAYLMERLDMREGLQGDDDQPTGA